MADRIEFCVRGEPKAQPRPRATVAGKHARVYNPDTATGWKRCIHAAAIGHAPADPIDRAVSLTLTYRLPRPRSHFGTGRNAARLKPSAPTNVEKKPDIENLNKAVMDALTDVGMWRDDCLVVAIQARKLWAASDPGVCVRIEQLDGPPDETDPHLAVTAYLADALHRAECAALRWDGYACDCGLSDARAAAGLHDKETS